MELPVGWRSDDHWPQRFSFEDSGIARRRWKTQTPINRGGA